MRSSGVANGGRFEPGLDHAAKLPASSGDAVVLGLTFAGADRRLVPAPLRVEGWRVIVWSIEVSEPHTVQIERVDSPEPVNQINGAGPPASLYRTDSWTLRGDGSRFCDGR